MNSYGTRAQDYWRRFRPTAYAAMTDPTGFFSTLGEQISDQVEMLADQLAGPDLPQEGYLGTVGRLTNARSRAREMAMNELVYSHRAENSNQEDQEDEGGRELATGPTARYVEWVRETDRQDQQFREQLRREREEQLDREAATLTSPV